MILQLGVKPLFFSSCAPIMDRRPGEITRNVSSVADLRSYMIDLPPVGDSVVPELLLKVLEPYRKEGWFCLLCVCVFLIFFFGGRY